MNLSFHPLSDSDRAHGWTAQHQQAWHQRVSPFIEAGVLSRPVVQVVDLLARRSGEVRPDVLLAAALAVRAPRHGHIYAALPDIGVDTPSERLPVADDASTSPPLPWPDDRVAWRRAVAASPLVQADAADAPPRPFVLSDRRLYPHRTWEDECTLAGLLHARTQASLPPVDAPLLRAGLRELFEPHVAGTAVDRQLLAAALACLRGFTIISGGPGTGKTWTVRNLLTLLYAQHLAAGREQAFRVCVGAPTGKAAARVQESLTADLSAFVEQRGRHALPSGTPPERLQAFFEGLEARTVHRLLRVDPRHPNRFKHGPDHPLAADVVIVDETSMLDLALMTRLIEAVPPTARLILLGDHHQLASVDAGCVLADLCRAARFDAPRLSTAAQQDLAQYAGLDVGTEIRTAPAPGLHDCGVQLVTSRRFTADSGVGAVARSILDGDGMGGRVHLQSDHHPDVSWLALHTDGTATRAFAELIIEGYGDVMRKLLAGPSGDEVAFHRALLADFNRFRLLCAHRTGRMGVRGLVELTEGLLSRTIRGFRPRGSTYPGRPIMVTTNDYSVRRYNGDIGMIVERAGRPVAVFPDGSSGVQYLSPARLPSHETVFAMTIHKSQGSEFAHAVVVLPDRPSPILTRELVYTGVTRAKTRLTVAGSAAVWDGANHRRVARASGLAERLGPGA